MYVLSPSRCESAYCLDCKPAKLFHKREALRRILVCFNALLHVTLTFSPDMFLTASDAHAAFQKPGVSQLRQRLGRRGHEVGDYFAAIHFKPAQLREDWFHVHVAFECSEHLGPVISELWPHGITIPGRSDISPQKAADYVMRYSFDPEYGWPEWFRNNRRQRFTCSKTLWSRDPRFRKKPRKARKSKRPRPPMRRTQVSVDDKLEQCGKGATIGVRRAVVQGDGEVTLNLAELPDLDLAKSVLRGKMEFTPADLVIADLGTSPEEYYWEHFGWQHSQLPAGYIHFVPKELLDSWNARRGVLITLSRLVSDEDWQAAGYPDNPIPALLARRLRSVISNSSDHQEGQSNERLDDASRRASLLF